MVSVLALSLCLVSTQIRTAEAAPAPGPGAPPPPVVISAPGPTPVTTPPPGAASPTAPAAHPAAVGAPPVATPPPAAAPVPQAVIEKIGQGDRHFLDHDYRAALFAYQDAVYLAPGHAPARVRLGKAYLAMRYPERAVDQAERALALDPTSAEARKLLDEARTPAPRPAIPAAAVQEAPRAPVAREPALAAPPATAQPPPQPRIYRLTPEPESREVRPTPAMRTQGAIIEPVASGTQHPSPAVAESQRAVVADGEPVRNLAPSAADRYRSALALLGNREFEKAVAELTEAIATDPRLGVAYAARASARFGLGRYREAADDYTAALGLDPGLGTPLYGLAECYRVLGDPARASDMYQRYSESRAPDVREDLRAIAAKRAQELR